MPYALLHFVRAMLAAALVIVFVPPLTVEAGARDKAEQQTKRIAVGPVSIQVPANWRLREGPAADNPHLDAPSKQPGLGPSVAISVGEMSEDQEQQASQEIKRETRVVAGAPRDVVYWRWEEDDVTGVTVQLDDVVPGKSYKVMGWSPADTWAQDFATILGIVDSLEVAGHVTDADQSEAGTDSVPGAEPPLGPVRRYDFGNKFAVSNGPSIAYTLKFDRPVIVRAIQTYHWNNGRGARPGTIGLKDGEGTLFGPWPATGTPGQDGVPNAYWRAEPRVRLEPGTYTIVTSNDRTWSTNREADGRGFFVMEWQEILDTPPSGGVSAKDTAPQEPKTSAEAVSDKPISSGEKKPTSVAVDGGTAKQGASDRVLFSGALEPLWQKLAVAGGNFDTFAKIEKGTLVVAVPPSNSWGKTGLWSAEPVADVPAAGSRSTSELTFQFDSARTSSYVVALGAKNDMEEWSAHDIRASWVRSEDGASATLALHVRQALAMSVKLGPDAPDKLTLTIAPDQSVRVSVPNGAHVEAMLPEGLAAKVLRIYVLAHSPGPNLPAAMALRSIVLSHPNFAVASQGVIFDGSLGGAWQALSNAGGDFNRFAKLENGALLIDVPAGNAWGKTGIWSRAPLVFAKRKGATSERETLRFVFDPAQTTSFVIALGDKDTLDEWSSHTVSFSWSRSLDGTSGTAVVNLRQQPVAGGATGPEAPGQIEVTVDASGLATFLLPGGRRFEAVVPEGIPAIGLRIYALAHAPGAGNPAKMALKQIMRTLAEVPENPLPVVYPDTRTTIPLFNGSLGTDWAPLSADGGDFSKHGRADASGVTIDVPEKNGWGRAGIASRRPAVWLRSFHADASVTIDFNIDPKATSGFRLVVHPGNSNAAAATFEWRLKKDGSGAVAEFAANPCDAAEVWRADTSAAGPSQVTFILTSGQVALRIDGQEKVSRNWPAARDGVGLKVMASASAVEAEAAVRFKLTSIDVKRTEGVSPQEPKPAEGVAPLAATVLFDGKSLAGWEPASVGGAEFVKHAKAGNGFLLVEVPAGQYSWGRVGLLSEGPVARRDERIDITAMLLKFKLDRAATSGIGVIFSYEKVADMWPRRLSTVTLIKSTQGRDAGHYVLSVEGTNGGFSRAAPCGWVEKSWTER